MGDSAGGRRPSTHGSIETPTASRKVGQVGSVESAAARSQPTSAWKPDSHSRETTPQDIPMPAELKHVNVCPPLLLDASPGSAHAALAVTLGLEKTEAEATVPEVSNHVNVACNAASKRRSQLPPHLSL